MTSVLVKGAGVAGLTAALELVRRGFKVEVWERKATIGHGASHYAGGMLAPFCEREAADEAVLTLGRGAADWWDGALPGTVKRAGTLVLAQPRDVKELDRFAARTQGYRWLDGASISALEPSLANRFERGLFFEEEAHLDPRQALATLFERLSEHDVRFRFGADVLAPADGFDCLVDCTGPAAIGSLPSLRGVRGEMIYLQTPDVALSRPVRMLHPRHPIYVVPRTDNRFMIGATMIESEDDGPIAARSMMEFLNTAYALHPAFGEARLVESGAGLRPAFDDNMPRVVETATGFAVAGMYRHGFLLSPALAQRLADCVEARVQHTKRRTA